MCGPAVKRGIIDASRGTDRHIQIHSQSWRTYYVIVQKIHTVHNIIVPVSEHSKSTVLHTCVQVRTVLCLYFSRVNSYFNNTHSSFGSREYYRQRNVHRSYG